MDAFGPDRGRGRLLAAAALLLLVSSVSQAQTTTFTYQGRLTDGGNLATGTYDLQFKVFDTVTVGTGTQQGATVVVPTVTVTRGLFTVSLDFGPGVFPGADRFLEVAVKRPADSVFSTLGPRQPLSSTPYSIKSLVSNSADGLSAACVNCVASGQVGSIQGSQVTGPIAGGQISGSIPVASVPAGSPSYIQNGTSPQSSADFNISGNGTAAILGAATQFNLGGSRILSTPGTNNLAAGTNAGASIGTGSASAFFGQNAGQHATTGSSNEFFGFNAGGNTTTGGNNAFLGDAAGFGNVSGSFNAMVGTLAGFNTNSSGNAFFGDLAGGNDTTGGFNSFFGFNAGANNDTGNSLTLVGAHANVTVSGLDHAAAIGADAIVSTSNTLVLGRPTDTTQVSGSLNIVGSQLSFAGSRVLGIGSVSNLFVGVGTGGVNTGNSNAFVGSGAGQANTSGNQNAFVGSRAGRSNTTGSGNAFIGTDAGSSNTTGFSNTFVGSGAGTGNTTGGQNSFFGLLAGLNNTTGGSNVYVGFEAAQGSNGDSNSFVGAFAGSNNAGSSNVAVGVRAGNGGSGNENVFVGTNFGSLVGTGSSNTFVGNSAGFASGGPPNPDGSSNTVIGAGASVTSGVGNGTAIGASAQVTQSNSLVLGSSFVKVGIGNTAPQARLHVTEGASNITLGLSPCGFGLGGISFRLPPDCATYALTGGDGDTYLNAPTGGTIHFRQGNAEQMTIGPTGVVTLLGVGSAGGTTLCRNASLQISFCSSSLRYKKDLRAFGGGMDLVNRLRPIAFNWKVGGQPDLGLGAEDVAKVEPRLVTYDDEGEVEGVKYDHLAVVFINAFKEQQSQIEVQRREIQAQQERLDRQEREIEALKKLILDGRAGGDLR